MIKLELIGNEFKYELENIIQLFYPEQKVSADEGEFLKITAALKNDEAVIEVEAGEKNYKRSQNYIVGDAERTLCELLFLTLKEHSGISPEWGIQTGVRPVKLLRSLIKKHGAKQARDILKDRFLISDGKLKLASDVDNVQRQYLSLLSDDTFSLYISIPFCRSRCSYCSFISHDVSKSAKLMPEYVELLVREIEYTANITKQLGLKLKTVYFGGGTPTALAAEQLKTICDAVSNCFDLSGVLEYTIEAGRPDTVTEEKLSVIKSAGAGRISINPQTLNDNVLKAVHRKHTVEEFYTAYNAARHIGFDCINTDLIAGLPSDDLCSFCHSLDGVMDIAAENITVHTLSIKRSSSLVYRNTAQYDAVGNTVSDMLGYAQKKLPLFGYVPYYMYRQSRMAGNNENIGWSKPGKESLYNIFIMEEVQTIIALGAGASTKLVKDGSIERIFNYKYPYEYIRGFDEILKRKDGIYEFFEN